MTVDVKKVARSYCLKTYAVLAKVDDEVRAMGIEKAMERFEEGFLDGEFCCSGNRILWYDFETGAYVDVTYLANELKEIFEEEQDEY